MLQDLYQLIYQYSPAHHNSLHINNEWSFKSVDSWYDFNVTSSGQTVTSSGQTYNVAVVEGIDSFNTREHSFISEEGHDRNKKGVLFLNQNRCLPLFVVFY